KFNLGFTTQKKLMFPFIFDNEDKKGFQYSLCLKRVESKLFPKTLKCNFLEEFERENDDIKNNNHPGDKVSARCSIYENRPSMCRTYPFSHNEQTKISHLKKREDSNNATESPAYTICPTSSLKLSDFGITNTSQLMKKNNDLMLSEARTEGHNEIVTRWNLQPDRKVENVVPFITKMINLSIQEFRAPNKVIQENSEKSIMENASKAVTNKSKKKVTNS
ncbi:MAG TPA: YkgJ family cysteine cluster protein, partial [Vampirovibrionales bacterium]